MKMTATNTFVEDAAATNRGLAVVGSAISLLALAVGLLLARRPLELLISALAAAVVWSVGTLLIGMSDRHRRTPSPLLVEAAALPPVAPTRMLLVRRAVALVVFNAALDAYALWQGPRSYFVIGIAFGVPVLAFSTYRRNVGTERAYNGTFWVPSKPIWFVNDRVSYVTRDMGTRGPEQLHASVD